MNHKSYINQTPSDSQRLGGLTLRELDVYPNRLFALWRLFERLEGVRRSFSLRYAEGEPNARSGLFHARAEVDSVSNEALQTKSKAKQNFLILFNEQPSNLSNPKSVRRK